MLANKHQYKPTTKMLVYSNYLLDVLLFCNARFCHCTKIAKEETIRHIGPGKMTFQTCHTRGVYPISAVGRHLRHGHRYNGQRLKYAS